MKLPRHRQFQRELEAVIARTRRGLAPGGLLLMLDLDGFGAAQQDPRHARRRRGPRGDRRPAARAGPDDRPGRAHSAATSSRCSIAAQLDAAAARRLATPRSSRSGGRSPPPAEPFASGCRSARSSSARRRTSRRRATLMAWADREMQIQKAAQKAGRTQSGIRFHRYGSAAAARPGAAERERRSWPGSRGGRIGPLELGAILAGGRGARPDGGDAGGPPDWLRRRRQAQRQMGVPPCSPTRSRPAANRPGSNGAMSTDVATPSRISSAMPRPIAGAVLNPVPLWPQSR